MVVSAEVRVSRRRKPGLEALAKMACLPSFSHEMVREIVPGPGSETRRLAPPSGETSQASLVLKVGITASSCRESGDQARCSGTIQHDGSKPGTIFAGVPGGEEIQRRRRDFPAAVSWRKNANRRPSGEIARAVVATDLPSSCSTGTGWPPAGLID